VIIRTEILKWGMGIFHNFFALCISGAVTDILALKIPAKSILFEPMAYDMPYF
jgi:hypothetical protein